MDLFNCMRVFIRVSEAGSFTAAARLLKVSTPHISRCVADLETAVQARLIQRNTRHQALTEAGERYLLSCKEIVTRVDEAAVEANESCLTPRGCLRVLANTEFGMEHLPSMVSAYSKEWPEVSLDLTLTTGTANLIDKRQDVQIILSRHDHLPSSEMVAQPLGTFSNIVCAAPSYLARCGVPLNPQNLGRHVCLRQPDEKNQNEWVFETAGETFVVPTGEALRANLAQTIRASAIAGMGVCILPSYIAAPALASGALKRLLPHLDLHPSNVYAIYSSRRFLDAKIKTWVDFLKEQVPQRLCAGMNIANTRDYFA